MRMHPARAVVACVLLAVVAAGASAQGRFGRRVLVTVVDSLGAPLPGAAVVVPAIGRAARTAIDGGATLAEVPRDPLSVRVRLDGYGSRVARLEAGDDDVTIAVELAPTPWPRPGIVDAALALPSGFDQRRRSGRFPARAFVPRAVLERRPELDVATVVRGPWRRERLVARAGDEAPSGAVGPRDPSACAPAVLVDGAEPFGWEPLVLPRAEVWAVEVHAPVDGPLPDVYEGIDGTCGVVAIWTHAPLEGLGDGAPPKRVRLRGRVVDRADRPVLGARVRAGEADTAVVDADGRFTLDVPEGPNLLHVVRLGSRPATVAIAVTPADSADEQVIRLAVDVTINTLSTVRVEGRRTDRPVPAVANLAGFEARRASGIYPRTAFLTADEFSDRLVQDLSDWLARIPGVRLAFQQSRDSRARRQVLVRGGAGTAPYCAPYVYLDGIPYDANGFIDVILPTVVAAVEVHRGLASTPPEYQRADNQCGAVLIWTRPR